MLPYSVLLNSFVFKEQYFNSFWAFSAATLVTFAIMAIDFIACGSIASFLRQRFSDDRYLNSRLALSITIFILSSAVLLSLMLRAYEFTGFLNYKFNDRDFIQGFAWLVVMNVFLTFLNEGITRFEQYRDTIKETEQLKKEYRKSQLLGLKSQVNPHFLFNSLNTLSSLIYEDSDKAEMFLNELSKVYRYLLRNDEEQLVSLETELAFAHSYHFLIKARYGEGFKMTIDVPENKKKLQLPPLTLQMLLENIFNFNKISKANPLIIAISYKNDFLEICNTIQPKLGNYDTETGLENIAKKFWLLSQQSISIETNEKERVILLPLINVNELSAV
jgi:sensor histidine kinase YesM